MFVVNMKHFRAVLNTFRAAFNTFKVDFNTFRAYQSSAKLLFCVTLQQASAVKHKKRFY